MKQLNPKLMSKNVSLKSEKAKIIYRICNYATYSSIAETCWGFVLALRKCSNIPTLTMMLIGVITVIYLSCLIKSNLTFDKIGNLEHKEAGQFFLGIQVSIICATIFINFIFGMAVTITYLLS